ncbi:protein of unknown function [Planctomicrobium piriforme]|uniref:DUF4832 domain-containing protein n=2 Tax=Planctomicrobium piriforme TaxID=1576369 RepID=A0A1I3HWE4_9PLAN|nr:protein of unknown function [Planctomicrobium piriforme]
MASRTLLFLVLVLAGRPVELVAQTTHQLEFASTPVDNPLKGLVPYATAEVERFPHSLEFDYLPFSALVGGENEYDWQPLENLLNTSAERGCQVVFRIYLEYPGRTGCIPKYLLDQGLTVHRYLNTNTQPEPPQPIETPDYEDLKLRKSLQQFIAALGKRYDGDPRIGFITAGLLGTWGEWHTYPRDELFASQAVQNEVMSAYEAAFKITPVLLRYPAGPEHESLAPNAQRNFGYHDDSFAWATLDTGKQNDDWFFVPALQQAGIAAVEKWKTAPIGGEIRPEAWGKVFDAKPGKKQIQNFEKCVRTTHASWLMDSGLYEQKTSPERYRRAIEQVRLLGYDFHVPQVTLGPLTGKQLPVSVHLENRGVAPFYYDWPVEFGFISSGRVVETLPSTGKITGLLPGDPVRIWTQSLDVQSLPAGKYRLALRVVNPLPQGKPLRFANAAQDADAAGWLTLGEIDIP